VILQHDVRVHLKLSPDWMPEDLEVNPESFSTRKLHRGNKIRISGNEHDGVDKTLQGEPCDIESDPHIHPLLLHIRHEVCGLGGHPKPAI
jgi:hypothetical protein